MSIKNDILFRFGIAYIFVGLIAAAIVIKVFAIMFVNDDRWKALAKEKSLKDITVPAIRGDIYAVDGRILAGSVPYYEVYMDTRATGLKKKTFENNVDSLSWMLAKLFTDSAHRIPQRNKYYNKRLRNARKQNNRYLSIAKDVNQKQLKQLKKFPIFRYGSNKGGLIIEQKNIRKKPFKLLASRTIGRLKNQSESQTVIGIEGAYNYELAGTNGVRIAQKISGNYWMPVPGAEQIEPVDGNDVVTTIDINLQDVAETALLKQLKKHNAHHGTAILMEVKTGEIKAIANLVDTFGTYREYYNYAIGFRTEPGSTFKLASMIALLEDGHIKPTDMVATGNGTTHYYGFPVRDTKRGGHGTITAQRAFEVSSNVGLSKLVTKYYGKKPKKFVDRLYAMNLDDPLGIHIKGEDKPYIKYPGDKFWSNVSLPQMAIGYEILLTPLQTLTLYNAIANNGKMIRPKFVKAIQEHGRTIREIETEIINASICSKSTIKTVQAMLLGVVERGTATNIRTSAYKIAGKTGTARLADDSRGYGSRYEASFAGYFPADNPTYSCIVVINTPRNNQYYGNLVAAPVFKEIADKVYASSVNMHKSIENSGLVANNSVPAAKSGYKPDLDKILDFLNVNPNATEANGNWVMTQNGNQSIKYLPRRVTGKTPYVIGMGARDAVAVLENLGYKVHISGYGKVSKQSIASGKPVQKGKTIKLILSNS